MERERFAAVVTAQEHVMVRDQTDADGARVAVGAGELLENGSDLPSGSAKTRGHCRPSVVNVYVRNIRPILSIPTAETRRLIAGLSGLVPQPRAQRVTPADWRARVDMHAVPGVDAETYRRELRRSACIESTGPRRTYCQKRVAVTPLPLPRVPRHCQPQVREFTSEMATTATAAAAQPLPSATCHSLEWPWRQ